MQKYKLNIKKINTLKMRKNYYYNYHNKNRVLKTLFELINVCSLIIILFRRKSQF